MDLRYIAEAIFTETLQECRVERAFERKLTLSTQADGHRLILIGPHSIDLDAIRHIRIVAVGKASALMLQSLMTVLQRSFFGDVSGVLIAHKRPNDLSPNIQFFSGGHPFPNEASLAGAHAALAIVRSLRQEKCAAAEKLCLFLISGGASAMMELPLDPTITLADTLAFHRALVHSGASITEINCVRKHFSAVKGGRLAMALDGVPSLSLMVSDVPPGQLDALGSGPTLPDSSTLSECRQILSRYNLLEQFTSSVQRFFTCPDLEETPKLEKYTGRIFCLLTSDDLAKSAQQHAIQYGFHTLIDNTCDDWDYRTAAEYLLSRLRELRRHHARVCVISTGEVSVRLPHSTSPPPGNVINPPLGVGGRNQHFCVYAATLFNPQDASTVILSVGSDGIDGHSKAAGAVVDDQLLGWAFDDVPTPSSATIRQQSNLRAEAQRALDSFDSSTFLDSMNATIVTGPTGTNLRDLRIFLACQP